MCSQQVQNAPGPVLIEFRIVVASTVGIMNRFVILSSRHLAQNDNLAILTAACFFDQRRRLVDVPVWIGVKEHVKYLYTVPVFPPEKFI